MAGQVEGALQMRSYHGIKILFLHFDQCAIPNNAGVIDQNIDLPKLLDGRGNDAPSRIKVRH